jgi:arylsulfatase
LSDRIGHTQPIVFSADETADVGIDPASPAVEVMNAKKKSRFTGKTHRVMVEMK